MSWVLSLDSLDFGNVFNILHCFLCGIVSVTLWRRKTTSAVTGATAADVLYFLFQLAQRVPKPWSSGKRSFSQNSEPSLNTFFEVCLSKTEACWLIWLNSQHITFEALCLVLCLHMGVNLRAEPDLLVMFQFSACVFLKVVWFWEVWDWCAIPKGALENIR